MDYIAKAFEVIDDPYIRERIQDVRLVAQRIRDRLLGQGREHGLKAIQSRVVLMAHDLSPADTIGIEVTKIMSFENARTLFGMTAISSGTFRRRAHSPSRRRAYRLNQASIRRPPRSSGKTARRTSGNRRFASISATSARYFLGKNPAQK